MPFLMHKPFASKILNEKSKQRKGIRFCSTTVFSMFNFRKLSCKLIKNQVTDKNRRLV